MAWRKWTISVAEPAASSRPTLPRAARTKLLLRMPMTTAADPADTVQISEAPEMRSPCWTLGLIGELIGSVGMAPPRENADQTSRRTCG